MLKNNKKKIYAWIDSNTSGIRKTIINGGGKRDERKSKKMRIIVIASVHLSC